MCSKFRFVEFVSVSLPVSPFVCVHIWICCKGILFILPLWVLILFLWLECNRIFFHFLTVIIWVVHLRGTISDDNSDVFFLEFSSFFLLLVWQLKFWNPSLNSKVVICRRVCTVEVPPFCWIMKSSKKKLKVTIWLFYTRIFRQQAARWLFSLDLIWSL